MAPLEFKKQEDEDNQYRTNFAKWYSERPYLTGGPLLGKYVFYQIHFHWGKNSREGSEHTVDAKRLPLEMHLVHFRSTYLKQEKALNETDGIVVVGFFFKLQSKCNPALNWLIKAMPGVQNAHSSEQLEQLPLSSLIKQFDADYFVYWGRLKTSKDSNVALWMLHRRPIGISSSQIASFRTLLNKNGTPIVKKFRAIQPLTSRRIFHVLPSGYRESTLLPI